MTSTARPPARYLAVLFAVSASMLGFEVLLVRLFEFSHWHHFAGLAVSLALLGLGAAGTCLAVAGTRGSVDGLIYAGIAIQAAGTMAVVLLHSHIAVRPLFAAWDGAELLRLLTVDFAAFIPFFGAGLVIGGIFARWPAASPAVYAANLLGSGAGSIAASSLLSVLDVERVLGLAALLPVLAMCLVAQRRRAMRSTGVVLLGVAGATLLAWPPAPAVSDFKALSRVLDLPDARVLADQPGLRGRLTLVRSDSLRNAPGLSLGWTDPVPAVDAVVIGSDHLLPLPRRYGDSAPPHLQASLVGLPFGLRPSGEVLILGTSAWQSPLAAASRTLTWVEPDGRLPALARQRGFSGQRKSMVTDGAYRYLVAADHRFELIVLDAAFAGGDAASEDYLMTVEGLAAALARLGDRGLMAVPLGLSVPPRQVPRALATLHRALARSGAGEPGRHVAVLRGLQEALLLASPQPLPEADLRAIRRFSERWRFDLVWLPGMGESQANRFHRLDTPLFHRAARAVFGQGAMPEAARWFNTSPAGLDQPYFWRSLAWLRIPDFLRSMGYGQASSYFDWTLLLSAFSAVVAATLAFVLILAPLGRLPAIGAPFSRPTVAGYFTALGLGYLLLELAMFQRAVLFVGEPVTTAALVFAVFLIGSGLGSMTTPRPRTGGRDAAAVFGAIAAGAVVGIGVLWPLAGPVLVLSEPGRMAAIAAALAPLAWAMGRAFPWALQQLSSHGRWVPWAWGINGFASVMSASLATLVSVHCGQSWSLGLALACYAAAALVAWRWVRLPNRRSAA